MKFSRKNKIDFEKICRAFVKLADGAVIDRMHHGNYISDSEVAILRSWQEWRPAPWTQAATTVVGGDDGRGGDSGGWFSAIKESIAQSAARANCSEREPAAPQKTLAQFIKDGCSPPTTQ
jgi:hypothetical protein